MGIRSPSTWRPKDERRSQTVGGTSVEECRKIGLTHFGILLLLFQDGSGTEPEPETGTVGTSFPETKRGTGTVGTIFQEPKAPKPDPSLSVSWHWNRKKALSRKEASEPKTGTARTCPCTNRNRRNRAIVLFALCEKILGKWRRLPCGPRHLSTGPFCRALMEDLISLSFRPWRTFHLGIS